MNRIIRVFIILAAVMAMLLSGCLPFGRGGAAATEPPTQEAASDEPIAQDVLPTTAVTVVQPTATTKAVPPTLVPTAVPTLVQLSGPYHGTVKPPGCNGIAVSASGSYSVCGMAVAGVTIKGGNIVLIFTPEEATPIGAGNMIVPAINVSGLLDGKVYMGPYDPYATVRLCYAAPIGKQVLVRFYNPQTNQWTSMDTPVQSGQACAAANFAGIYVLIQL